MKEGNVKLLTSVNVRFQRAFVETTEFCKAQLLQNLWSWLLEDTALLDKRNLTRAAGGWETLLIRQVPGERAHIRRAGVEEDNHRPVGGVKGPQTTDNFK